MELSPFGGETVPDVEQDVEAAKRRTGVGAPEHGSGFPRARRGARVEGMSDHLAALGRQAEARLVPLPLPVGDEDEPRDGHRQRAIPAPLDRGLIDVGMDRLRHRLGRPGSRIVEVDPQVDGVECRPEPFAQSLGHEICAGQRPRRLPM